MPKSKYPSQIDTSVELPTVRDNITEIGSDALNSFKSAILALEKTLGVNPQGAAGNTVASRLNRILDPNGDLLPSAITQAGLIAGPITDNEISGSAAIEERKLNLNFPTQLLQDEISMLQAEIDQFDEALSELAAKFATHVSPEALNRHSAVSISVDAATSVGSNVATLDLASGSLQDVWEELYNAHINYTGLNVSATNNSHSADQIYFNNENIQEVSTADDVQSVIEDLSGISGSSTRNSNLNLNSNGLIRKGSVTDEYEGNEQAAQIVASSSVTYTQSEGASRTTFVFTENPTPTETISAFDLLVLSGSTEVNDNKAYSIAEVTLTGGDLSTVEVFGGPIIDSAGGLTAVIYKNPYRIYNPAGLLSSVRPRNDKTNTPDVQVANPNSATIISTQIIPESITITAHTFDISIDGGTAVTIETYDSNVANQSLDSIVNKINEQAVDNRLNFAAFKYRANKCFELAIVHLLPNASGDTSNRTITISTGSTNDGTTELGLSSILDTEVEGTSGNSILLNGSISSIFGKIQTFTGSDIEIVSGTQGISLATFSFPEYGIRNGDTMIIEGSSDSNDDGAYRITAINDSNAEIDITYTFAGALDSDSTVYFIRNSAPVGELTFTEIISASGSIIFDVFMDNDLDIFYTKRLEIDGDPRSGSFIGAVIDISRSFITSEETGTITIDTDGTAYVTGPDGNPGEAKFVASPGDYKLFASDGFSFVTLRVGSTGNPNSQIILTCYGFDEIGRGSYHLSRGTFSTTIGRVIGYPSEAGIPAIIDKRETGTVDETIISEAVIEKYIQGPRNELRGFGIIQGLQVANVQLFYGYQTFDVGAGVAVVNGIRIEFPGKLGNRINTEEDFYVGIDAYGCIVAGESILNPDGYTADNQGSLSPFYNASVAHLAAVEAQTVYDLRLFIDRIDYKLLGEILVSNQRHFGHFDNISDAVEYARRFTDMFPDASTPCIKIREGLYEVSSPIILDFDVVIKGSGRNTYITKSGALATGAELVSSEPEPLECVFYIGNLTSVNSDEIVHGITISDMTYQVSESLTNVGTFITLAEARNTVTESTRYFRVHNILMEGPQTINYNGGADADVVGEYFIVMGFADIVTVTPTSDIYTNLHVTDCVLRRVGVEYGPCRFRDAAGMTYTNILCSGNIGKGLSPNENDTSFEIFETVSTATLNDVLEVGNIIQ
jgi:hypothetical protein